MPGEVFRLSTSTCTRVKTA